jgi:hypothetical protein
MKLTKSDLKSIVKECLLEILNEGLSGSSPLQSATAVSAPRNSASRSLSDSVRRQSVVKAPPHLREVIAREAGGNKVMESILADTAASTLPKFLQAGEGKTSMPAVGGGLVEQVVSQTNPEELFGDEVASKWASLAFMDSPTKK